MRSDARIPDPAQEEHHRKLVQSVRASGLAGVYFAWASGRLEEFLAEREHLKPQATKRKVEYEREIPRPHAAGG